MDTTKKTYICVSITDGKATYSEVLDTEEELEYWEDISTNGSNPQLKGLGFYDYWKPWAGTVKDLNKVNGIHGIFGWWESFWQREGCPGDSMDDIKIVEVFIREQ